MRPNLLSTFLSLAVLSGALAQSSAPPEGTRGLWDDEFKKFRSGQPSAPKAPAPVAKAPAHALLGLTLFRLRPSAPRDPEGVRMLLHHSAKEKKNPEQQFTPERIGGTTTLTDGERVQMSIESGRPGYLYVVTRERYADGALGEPYLIFPADDIGKGVNYVRAGRVVQIPGPGDDPPYFEIDRKRPDYLGEHIIILVSPKPLPNLKAHGEPLPLKVAQLEDWEKQWGARFRMLDDPQSVGKALTEAEKRATLSGQTLLTGRDSVPQILYSIEAGPDTPLLVSAQLSLAAKSPAAH